MRFLVRQDKANPLRRLQLALAALVMLLVVGTLGFMVLGDASFIDALLMTVVTVATVGYQEEVALTTTPIKMFAIGLILSAVLTTAWAVSSIAELIFAEYLWTFLGRQRMQRQIDDVSDHIIVCGMGRMGRAIVHELSHEGQRVVMMDTDESRIERMSSTGELYVIGDATNDESLLAVGIERASAVISVTAHDPVNLMIVLSARALNPKLRIAVRASEQDAVGKLYLAGADYVLHHHGTGANHLALSVTHPVVEDVLNDLIPREGSLDFGQLRVEAGDSLEGRTVADVGAGQRDALILAIRRGDELMLPPPVNVPLQVGDVLVVAGTAGSLRRLGPGVDQI